jgi:hypothetical protein
VLAGAGRRVALDDPSSSAAAYTKGLNAEPFWRRVIVARLKPPTWSRRPACIASTSPLSGARATIAASTWGASSPGSRSAATSSSASWASRSRVVRTVSAPVCITRSPKACSSCRRTWSVNAGAGSRGDRGSARSSSRAGPRWRRRVEPPGLHHALEQGVAPLLCPGRVGPGVAHRGRRQQLGERGRLVGLELGGGAVEVGARRGLDAVGALAEVHLVQVALEDLVLVDVALELDRDHRLAHLAQHACARRRRRPTSRTAG